MWGWNPDTLGSLATAFATLLAALAALLAVRDVLQRRAKDVRSQADRVAAWTTLEEVQEHEYSGIHLFDVTLWVANRSELPVINLLVSSMPAVTLSDIEPVERRWHSLGPGQIERETLGQTDGHDALGYPGRVLSVEFTDHSGRRWRRDEDYRLLLVETEQ